MVEGEKPGRTRTLERVVLSTDGVSPSQRFDFWRSCFFAVNEVEVTKDAIGSFTACSEQWRLGPFLLGLNTTPERRLLRSADRIRRDDLDHWIIRVSCNSTGMFQTKGATYACGPGAISVTSLGDGYVEHRTAGDWIALIFTRDAFPQLTSRLERLGSAPLPQTGTGGLLTDYLMALSVRVRTAPAAQGEALAEMTRAMLAGCLPAAETSEPDIASDLVQRARIERAIRRNIGSARLDVSRLCTLTGISRSSLYRMFETTGGVAAYVRRLRLRMVDEDLRNPELASLTIATLAERRGFHCAASFSRSYRETFGRSPRETREATTRGLQIDRAEPRRAPAVPAGLQPLLVDLLP